MKRTPADSLKDFVHRLDTEKPSVLLVSGADPEQAAHALDEIRRKFIEKTGNLETILFTGEPGDEMRFLQEVMNIPLFVSHRLVRILRGEDFFKPVLASRSLVAKYREDLANLPDRTLVVVEYSGKPPAELLKIFGDGLFHHQTRELFENQILDAIRDGVRRRKLNLSEEAVHELRELLPSKPGIIEMKLDMLADRFSPNRNETAGPAEIREILFPHPGMNSFELVDAIFARNRQVVNRELNRFNPGDDNFFQVTKLMLNRLNEIRRAAVGRSLGMDDRELLEHLKLGSRPAFVQKKILKRLAGEIVFFQPARLDRCYDFLIRMHNAFRGGVSTIAQQKLFFQEMTRQFIAG